MKEISKKDRGELSLEEVLSFALRLELKAQKLYEKIDEKNNEKSVEYIVERLIEDEESHESKIRSMFNDFFPDKEIEDLDIGDQIADDMEIKSEEYTVDELLKSAIEKEKNSSEFYRNMAKGFDEKAASNLLSYLAYTENEHRNLLKRELSDRV